MGHAVRNMKIRKERMKERKKEITIIYIYKKKEKIEANDAMG